MAETRQGLRDRLGDDLAMALRFFSRLPTGPAEHRAPDLNRMAGGLGFASVLIGAGPAVLLAALAFLGLPPLVAAGFAVGASALVTGAMSEDALADAFDGLFGGATADRRLEIMKDSRHGTYGVLALVLAVLIRVAGLASVVAVNPLAGAALLIATGVLARSAGLWMAVALPAARTGGASATAGRLGARPFWVGMGLSAVIGFALAAPFTSVLAFGLAAAAAAGVATLWVLLCRRLVGGQTGDLIGALIGLIELATLTVILAFH